MKKLATQKETQKFGGLGYIFSIEEMISQLKVMHDDMITNRNIAGGYEWIRMDCIALAIRTTLGGLEYIQALNAT